MKKHVTVAIFFALLIAGKFPSDAFAQMQSDTIIAIVNDEIITLKDFQSYLHAIYMQLSSSGMPKDEIKRAMDQLQKEGIERLVNDRLLISQANKKEVIVKTDAIDEKVNEIKKHYANDQEFMTTLVSEGLTLSNLRERIADQIKVKFIVDMEVKNKIFVNPQEVTEFYQKNQELFRQPEGLELNSIFIPYRASGLAKENDPKVTSADENDAWAKAQEALRLIKEGKDFTEAANQFSALPSVGIIRKGEILPEIETEVFGLREGEISQPLKTKDGIYIFKVKARLPPETLPLEKVKDKIYNNLSHDKFQKRMKSWLEDLKKKAYIEIKS